VTSCSFADNVSEEPATFVFRTEAEVTLESVMSKAEKKVLDFSMSRIPTLKIEPVGFSETLMF
jgi:hypothetical protein